MSIYYLIDPEEIVGGDPCSNGVPCSLFYRNECRGPQGICTRKREYDTQQALLSHAKKVDVDELTDFVCVAYQEKMGITVLIKEALEQFLQSKLEGE